MAASLMIGSYNLKLIKINKLVTLYILRGSVASPPKLLPLFF